MNQVISFERLHYFGFIFESAGMLDRQSNYQMERPRLVFGKRADKHSPSPSKQRANTELNIYDSEALLDKTSRFFTPSAEKPKSSKVATKL